MEVKTTVLQVDIDEVNDLIVTPIVEDPDNNGFVRDIRIMGVQGTQPVLILQVRIRADTEAKLNVSVPPGEF